MALFGLTDQSSALELLPVDTAQNVFMAQAATDAAPNQDEMSSEEVVENTVTLVENEAGETSVATSDNTAQTGTATTSHNVEGAIFPPFDPGTFGPQLFWLALTFGALYLLMSKVALPRIGEILEVRRDRIEGDLAEAERLRQKTDQAIETYETELATARSKSHAIAEQTRNELKEQLDGKQRDVETDLARQVASAETRIQKTKAEALTNVEQIAAETAVTLVSKLTSKVSIKDARTAVTAVVKG